MAAAAGADFGPRRDPDAVRRNTFARPALHALRATAVNYQGDAR
jgi:hypothetical protein